MTQDRGKAAKIIGCPNAGQADVGAKAPIKGFSMDSSAKLESVGGPLIGAFRPNVTSADVGLAKNFCRFSTILSNCAAAEKQTFVRQIDLVCSSHGGP